MNWPAAYQAHEKFVEPARATAEIWRLIVGLILAIFAYIMLSQIFLQMISGGFSQNSGQILRDIQTGSTPLGLYMLFFTFAFMSVAVGLSASLMHKRSFATLLGHVPSCVRDFGAVSFVVVLVLVAVFVLPPWDMGEPLVPNLALGTWLALLLPSLFFVLVQTSAEEIVFRGYIQQQLGARFSSPLVWMVLPAVLFASLHYLPDTAGENALLIAVWAGVFGLLMADLTARSGTLGPAIAVHFWNNVSAMLIVSLPGELSSLALYHTPFGVEDKDILRDWLWVDFMSMFVLWLAARLAIKR